VGGNFWWNLGIGTAGGGLQAETNNLLYNQSNNVLTAAATSGLTSGLGFWTGDKLSRIMASQNPASLNPVIFGNLIGGSTTEITNHLVEKNVENNDEKEEKRNGQ
jgi:hypothetical protein